jgi:hypothetical protein
MKFYYEKAICFGVLIIGSAGIFVGPDKQITGLHHNIIISLVC